MICLYASIDANAWYYACFCSEMLSLILWMLEWGDWKQCKPIAYIWRNCNARAVEEHFQEFYQTWWSGMWGQRTSRSLYMMTWNVIVQKLHDFCDLYQSFRTVELSFFALPHQKSYVNSKCSSNVANFMRWMVCDYYLWWKDTMFTNMFQEPQSIPHEKQTPKMVIVLVA